MTAADILIVVLFLCCDMERCETNVILVCLLCMDAIYMCVWGGRIYKMPCTLVTLDFQRARAFHRGLCKNVLHCPILLLCEALALVRLQRNVSVCSLSALLEVSATYFGSFQLLPVYFYQAPC